MRLYETMLLVDPRLEEAAINAVVDKFQSHVTDRGGEVAGVDRWGRRRLAYEIEDLQEGYYAVVTYKLDPGKRKDLEGALPFVEGLVRSKTVFPEPRTRRVKS